MKDKQKIALAELIINYFASMKDDDVALPKFIGTLNKKWGLNGFKPAEPGTPVFELSGKYFFTLESLDGKRSVEVPFTKETLHPAIDFKSTLDEQI